MIGLLTNGSISVKNIIFENLHKTNYERGWSVSNKFGFDMIDIFNNDIHVFEFLLWLSGIITPKIRFK